jgi:hypothetical protein
MNRYGITNAGVQQANKDSIEASKTHMKCAEDDIM